MSNCTLTVGVPYLFQFTAADGVEPYIWSLLSGSFPPGLTLSSSGLLSGTPTSLIADYPFTVQVVDDTLASATSDCTLHTNVTTDCVLIVGNPYSFTFAASGGVPPYVWTLVSGAFPPGLTLSVDGVLSGTPTAFIGTYNFIVGVTDANLTLTLIACSFVGPDSQTCTHPLLRTDEYAAQSFSADWIEDLVTSPYSFSISVTPPVQLQLIPPPPTPGTLDLCTVDIGPVLDLNPLLPTVLGIPDDLCWGTKWGALAQLLSSDGDARDPARSQAAQQLYDLAVSLGRNPTSTLMAQVDGREVPVSAIADMDQYNPEWQCTYGLPSQAAMVGSNLLVLAGDDANPSTGVPDAAYPVTVDLARSFPVPDTSTPLTSYIQLGPELLSAILDMAQHIASFKMAGPEFAATTELRDNFLKMCGRVNARLKSNAVYNLLLTQPATRQDFKVPVTTPREEDKVGSGSGGN